MILKQNILATLAYYDVLDLPLKAEEVWARLFNFRHLHEGKLEATNPPAGEAGNLEDINKNLDQLVFNQIVGRVGEYYFLFDKEYLVPLRLKNEKIAKYKWRKTRHAMQWLRSLPYVEAVFASGSLAINNTSELSDLDVLVVARHGRIWMVRLLISAALSILRVRRRGSDKIAPDKICLNHYITDESLKVPFKSIYNAQTYSNFVPVYIRSTGLIDEFRRENAWVQDFVFNWNISNEPIIKNGLPEVIAKFMEAILDIGLGKTFEGWAKHWQYKRIADNPVTKESGGRIIFNDEQLEFHPHSIESSIVKQYNSNLIKLGLPDLAVEKDSGLTK